MVSLGCSGWMFLKASLLSESLSFRTTGQGAGGAEARVVEVRLVQVLSIGLAVC